MSAELELLTPSEVAVVAAVSVRDVNRAIDEAILPETLFRSKEGRRFHPFACSMVNFYFNAARTLTSDERLSVITELSSRVHSHRLLKGRWSNFTRNWRVSHEYLTIDFRCFVTSAEKRYADLMDAKKMVVSDPEILSGTPVITGTRVPVYDVASSVASGIPLDRILSAYPTLDARKVELAKIYADATPPRGRPKSIVERSNLKVVSRRTVPRRARNEDPH